MKRIIYMALLVGITLSASLQAGAALDIPGIGMIIDHVNFDGIRLKDFKFIEEGSDRHDLMGDKYVITSPGKECLVEVSYKIDSNILENLTLHHLIYGLHKDGPQGCFVHSLGLYDRKGTAQFIVTAPKERGVYQIRFCRAQGYGTFEDVKNQWWEEGAAGSNTIMGIVIVR